MDTSQWIQVSSTATGIPPQEIVERKPRPLKEQALNCPRCNSTNTKFCYYNNYSLSQPRFYCKACKRYWTQGGTLRNVPVGGGSRKNKKHSSNSSSKMILQPNSSTISTSQMFAKPNQGQDLNLNLVNGGFPNIENTASYNNNSNIGAMYNNGAFVLNNEFSTPPSYIKFPLNGFGSGMQEGGGRLFFPNFGEMKEPYVGSSNENDHQNNPCIFWNTNFSGSSI